MLFEAYLIKKVNKKQKYLQNLKSIKVPFLKCCEDKKLPKITLSVVFNAV